MTNKYTYNGENITLDIIMKVEKLVSILAERNHSDFDTEYAKFLLSKTYKTLQNTNSTLWAETAEFIISLYDEEHLPFSVTCTSKNY
jgi:hypothetical protein